MGAENKQEISLFCSFLLGPKLKSMENVYSQADEVLCASNASIAETATGGSLRLKARDSSLSVELWAKERACIFFFFLFFSHTSLLKPDLLTLFQVLLHLPPPLDPLLLGFPSEKSKPLSDVKWKWNNRMQ